MTGPDPSVVVSSEDGAAATTAEDLRAEQIREWNTYRARAAIDFYGQRAYNTGDKVPVSAVEGEHAWIDERLVERIPDQPDPTPPPPAIDPATVAAPPVSSPDVVDLTPDDAPPTPPADQQGA
jgi:hypothetical protein